MTVKKEVQIYRRVLRQSQSGWLEAAILMYKDAKRDIRSRKGYNKQQNGVPAAPGSECLEAMPAEAITDSAYLHNAFSKGWLESWQQRNWIKSDKKPVIESGLVAGVLRLRFNTRNHLAQGEGTF